MRQDVIARQVAAMKDAGLDAILSISPENFAYVTGFLSPTAPIMRWRHAMALVTADGTCALVSVDMEANTIRAKAPKGMEIAVWREFKFDAMQVLADLLRKHGIATARIGMEMDYLPAGDFARLQKGMPRANFVANDPLWRGHCRLSRSPGVALSMRYSAERACAGKPSLRARTAAILPNVCAPSRDTATRLERF